MRTSSSSNRGGRRGFVLVSVLMLGVLLISCATAFTWFVRTQVRGVLRERVALTNRSMARLLASTVIAIIAEVSGKVDADSPIQEWFRPFLFPADNLGLWAVQVMPLDDKLPIGNLFLPDGNTVRMEMRAPWEDMWDALGHRELAVPVLDFLDKDEKGRVGGVERKNFLNRSLLDLSELLSMEEITPEIFYGEQGRPGVVSFCTIWSGGRVNLNTAPPEVLRLLPGLDGMQVNRLVDYRRERTLKSLEDVRQIPGLSPRTATQLTNVAGFRSRYFSLRIEFLDESPGGTAFHIIFDRTSRRIVRWEES